MRCSETSSSTRLLVTDDNIDFRGSLCEGLRRRGYSTVEAADGWEALSILADLRVDMLIADIHMPRLDGLEMLERVRQLPAHLPCILMSAELDELLIDRAKRLSPETVLAKPFSLATVSNAIRQILASRGC